jgi:hypothetical protein
MELSRSVFASAGRRTSATLALIGATEPDLRPLQIDLPKTVFTLEVFSTSEA